MFAGTAVTIVVATERRNGKGFNSSLRELAVREVPEVLALALVFQAELEVVLQQHLSISSWIASTQRLVIGFVSVVCVVRCTQVVRCSVVVGVGIGRK
jgi:hypothetical protein